MGLLLRQARGSGGTERMAELKTKDEIRELVRERYAESARSVEEGRAGCCGPSESSCGCGTDVPDACGTEAAFGVELYGADDRDALPEAAKLASLGCGNPSAVVDLTEARGRPRSRFGRGHRCAALGPSGRPHREGLRARHDRRDARARTRQPAPGRSRQRRVPQGNDRGDPAARRFRGRDHLELRDQPLGRQACGVRRGGAGAADGRPLRCLRRRRRPGDGRGRPAATWPHGPDASPAR